MEKHNQQKLEANETQPLNTRPPELNGDFALGQRTLPKAAGRPDYARGQEQVPSEEGPDFARGLRTLPRHPEGPDYARGLRGLKQ